MKVRTRARCSLLSNGCIQMAWAASWTTRQRMTPSQKSQRRRTTVHPVLPATRWSLAVLITRRRLAATSIWRLSRGPLQQQQKLLGRGLRLSRWAPVCVFILALNRSCFFAPTSASTNFVPHFWPSENPQMHHQQCCQHKTAFKRSIAAAAAAAVPGRGFAAIKVDTRPGRPPPCP